MTGLDKITSQIQEEAEASAKERIEAAQKEAEQILADAKAACEAMEKEASDKAAALKTVQDGRIHSAAEQKRKTALLKAKQEIIAEIIGSAYQTLKERSIFPQQTLDACRLTLRKKSKRLHRRTAEA